MAFWMEIVDDFLVDENKEHWVGIVVNIGNKIVWIFEDPVHGCDIYFGNSPSKGIGRNWSR